MTLRASSLGLLLLTLTGAADAQEIEVDDRRTVDFFQGPVVSSHRVIGLGGAYVGVAFGADGHLVNPASFTVRDPFTADDFYEWDVALSLLKVTGEGTDLTQSGREGAFDEVEYLQGGGHIKLGRHGFGVHGLVQRYRVQVVVDGQPVQAEYKQSLGGPGYAFNFLDGELVVGVAAFGSNAALEVAGERLVAVKGAGLLAGGLWGPFDERWRAGITYRTAQLGVEVEGDFVLALQKERVARLHTILDNITLGQDDREALKARGV